MAFRYTPLLALLLLPLSAAAQHTTPPPGDEVRVPLNVSFWRGVSVGDAVVGGDTTRRVVHNLSLNLPYGEAYRLEGVAVGIAGSTYRGSVVGVQVGGVGNVVGEGVLGAQVGGIGNVAGGSVRGLQVSGLGNVAGGALAGVQGAGLANIAGDGGIGLQGAGLANIVGDRFAGVQGAGLMNIVGDGFTGAQGAGLLNIVGQGMMGVQSAGLANIIGEGGGGVQAAGLANITGGDFTGLQGAGLANIAEEVRGVQAAGLANIAGATRGLQLALVNISGSSAGLQVGLVNIAGEQRGVPVGLYSRSGGVPVHLDVWADETAAALVSVRSGSAIVTNYAGVGARPFARADLRWDAHAGLGVVQPLGARGTWGVEGLAHVLVPEDFGAAPSWLFRLRAPVSLALDHRASVFAGPSLNVFVSTRSDGGGLVPYTLFSSDGETTVRGWVGAVAGLRVRIAEGGTRFTQTRSMPE